MPGPTVRLLLLLTLAWAPAGPANACSECGTALAAPLFDAVGDASTVPDGVVSSLAEDAQGYLWIGSAGGLVRYDGHRFRLYGSDFSAHSTGSAVFIRSLLRARDGRLWVGTESNGVAVYHPDSDRFSQLLQQGDDSSLSAGSVRALAEADDGRIWIGTIGGGLDLYDPVSGRFQHFRPDSGAGALPDGRVQSLLNDRDGRLWVGSWNGLVRQRADGSGFEAIELPSADARRPAIAQRIYQASDGQIWIGSQDGRLFRLQPQSLRVVAVGIDDLAEQHHRSTVYDFAEPTAGELWVGRASGIEIRAASDGTLLRRLRHDPAQPRSLAGNEVRALLRDRAGLIWVGGYGGGVQRHNPANRAFWIRGRETGFDGVLADANIRAVAPLRDGRIVLGTHESGLAVLDTHLRLLGALPIRSGPRTDFRGGRVSGLAQASNGDLWIGGDAGLYRYRLANEQLQRFDAGAGRTRIIKAVGNDVWIGTEDGLYRYRGGSERIERVVVEGGQRLGGDVNALAVDAQGVLWVGTENGLARLLPNQQQLQLLRGLASSGSEQVQVLGLLVDSRQRLWVDTPAGLHRLLAIEAGVARFDPVSQRLGVHGRPLGANLLEDSQGRIWTHQFVFWPDQETLYELTRADGVDIGTGWFRAYAATADGRMLFGGSRGLLVVDPDLFAPSDYPPPVVLTELRINGQRQDFGRNQSRVLLQPDQRSIQLEFAALDFSAPERCLYRYQLQGFDPAPVLTDASYRVASYSNLAPGRYTFLIEGSNRSGRWSPHRLEISLQVLPAWWQTWWVRAGSLLLGLIAVVAAVRLRTAYLLRLRRRLERKVEERTAELRSLSEVLQRKSRELEEASLTDPLTGLRNRRFLSQHIETDLALAIRHHENRLHGRHDSSAYDLIFFLVDIDHFKAVNDNYGHAAGDAVLVQMRQRLTQVFRDSDYLVRWGGEEFLIVARATSRDFAEALAERARRNIAETPFELDDGQPLSRTCSIGFACFPPQPGHPRALDWTAVVDLADRALYAAKRSGRNGWVGLHAAEQPPLPADSPARLAELLDAGVLRAVSRLPAETVDAGLRQAH